VAISFGLCVNRRLQGNQPLNYLPTKIPTYVRFFEMCQQEGWRVYVLSQKTYQSKNIFKGGWLFKDGRFILSHELLKLDFVYDRTNNLDFPPKDAGNMLVINNRNFKEVCVNKFKTYQEIGKYMPETFWVGEKNHLKSVLPKIKTAWVVLKPYNGMEGIGIFVGPKHKAMDLQFCEKYPLYIAQEFIDTAGGIPGIVKGKHDLRVVVVNGEVVWCHFRTPPRNEFTANVARGGSITEVDYDKQVPKSIKEIVEQIIPYFYQKYDNPIYCLDFGMGKDGPKIFEINDNMGFPLWEMKNRDKFLKALIENFKEKLEKRNVRTN